MSGVLVSDPTLAAKAGGATREEHGRFAPWLCSMGLIDCLSSKGWETGSGKDLSTFQKFSESSIR